MKRASRKEYMRKWRSENPDKIKDQQLRHKYGISLEEFKAMLAKQNNGCGVCGYEIVGKDLHVDHDHRTGKVRGLLCSNCNTGLGKFHDSTLILELAIHYLERVEKEISEEKGWPE